jgi:hypothetical protein
MTDTGGDTMQGPTIDSVTMAKAKREARQLGCSLSYKQEFCEWTLCHTASQALMFFDSLESALAMAPILEASHASQDETEGPVSA